MRASGLFLIFFVFAVQIYLNFALASSDRMSMAVAFYCMANAADLLCETQYSYLIHKINDLVSCLVMASTMTTVNWVVPESSGRASKHAVLAPPSKSILQDFNGLRSDAPASSVLRKHNFNVQLFSTKSR
jgi:hypothetical protein